MRELNILPSAGSNPARILAVRPGTNRASSPDKTRCCVVVDDDGKVEANVLSVEERIAFLDGTVRGHSKMIDGVGAAVAHLEQRMDGRFAQVGDRFDRVEARMERGFARIDERFDKMDARMDRQFRWVVGILLTAMLAMFGTLGSVLRVALQG